MTDNNNTNTYDDFMCPYCETYIDRNTYEILGCCLECADFVDCSEDEICPDCGGVMNEFESSCFGSCLACAHRDGDC